MISLIIYLIESSIVLTAFYLLYVLVLKKETFFNLNRFFLLGIVLCSLMIPHLSLDFTPDQVKVVNQPIEEINRARMSYHELMETWDFETSNTPPEQVQLIQYESESSLDWKSISLSTIVIIYCIGIIFCLSRTFWTLSWIRKLIVSSPKEKMEGIIVVKTVETISPFSFLNYVFVHQSLMNTTEFDQIMAHEKTHIKEKHSYDLIFVQLLAAFFWFNPVIWRLIKSLKTAHEYIADKKMINAGYSLVEYQSLLLQQLISNHSHGLVHNFNLSFIKKRITMMQNNKSGWSGRLKATMAVVGTILVGAIIIQGNSAMAQEESSPVAGKEGFEYPRWNNTYDKKVKKKDALMLTIFNNQITFEGKEMDLVGLSATLKESRNWTNKKVWASIDASQTMGLVDSVFLVFREFNVRKFVFEGRSFDGTKPSYLMINLPPRKNFETDIPWQNDVTATDDSFLWVDNLMTKEYVVQNNLPFFGIFGSDVGGKNFAIDKWPPIEGDHNKGDYPNRNLSGDLKKDLGDFVNSNGQRREKQVYRHAAFFASS